MIVSTVYGLLKMEKLNNLVHTYSSKPILYTSRDAVIVAIVTVLVMILITFMYYLATGNLEYMGTSEYWTGIGRSFVTSFILGILYEYLGVNSRLSADAMRFAKGTVLDKYETRNEAIVAEYAANEWRNQVTKHIEEADVNNDTNDTTCIQKVRSATTKLDKNIDRINAMVRSTREQKLIARGVEDGQSSEEILKNLRARYQTRLTLKDIDNLRNLDPEDPDGNLARLNAVPRAVELFGANPDLVTYFMREGFNKLRADRTSNNPKNPGSWQLDPKKLAADTGVKINLVGIGRG